MITPLLVCIPLCPVPSLLLWASFMGVFTRVPSLFPTVRNCHSPKLGLDLGFSYFLPS